MDQERVTRLIGRFRTKGFGICISLMLQSARHADATYEIPTNLLSADEVGAFKQALCKLDPSVE